MGVESRMSFMLCLFVILFILYVFFNGIFGMSNFFVLVAAMSA